MSCRPNSAPLPQGQVAFNPPEVYVNQLVSSTLSLVELNLRIELEADWWSSPRNDAIANFTVEPLNGTEPVEIGLKLRLPGCDLYSFSTIACQAIRDRLEHTAWMLFVLHISGCSECLIACKRCIVNLTMQCLQACHGYALLSWQDLI